MAVRTQTIESSARERLVHTAHDLFGRDGVNTVGVDRIVAEAGVSKSSLYRHFRSKDELVLAVIELHEETWVRGWLEREVDRLADSPQEKLLAIFAAFDSWFRQRDFEGCLFINSLVESGNRKTMIGAAAAAAITNVRAFVLTLAVDAGVRDPSELAQQWLLLMQGSILLAVEGDLDAAVRAKAVAELLLALGQDASRQ